MYICMYACMYMMCMSDVHVYVCMYVCVCVCIYIYIYIYTYIHQYSSTNIVSVHTHSYVCNYGSSTQVMFAHRVDLPVWMSITCMHRHGDMYVFELCLHKDITTSICRHAHETHPQVFAKATRRANRCGAVVSTA
jgi:hypothetical protein